MNSLLQTHFAAQVGQNCSGGLNSVQMAFQLAEHWLRPPLGTSMQQANFPLISLHIHGLIATDCKGNSGGVQGTALAEGDPKVRYIEVEVHRITGYRT